MNGISGTGNVSQGDQAAVGQRSSSGKLLEAVNLRLTRKPQTVLIKSRINHIFLKSLDRILFSR